jgi:transcriptional regulator with XRE-family HTH domain
MSTITLKEELRARHALPPPAARRELRRARGASQDAVAREVARRTGKNCTRRSVSTWEKDEGDPGSRKPRGANLVAYAAVLRLLAESGLDIEGEDEEDIGDLELAM